MTVGQSRDEGDYFPFVRGSTSNVAELQAATEPSKTKRSLTPRGLLFSDLSEAHRNITSRLGSNNPYRNASCGSNSTHSLEDRDISSSSFGQPITERLSRDDSELPRASSAAQHSLLRARSYSVDSANPFLDPPTPDTIHPESASQQHPGTAKDNLIDMTPAHIDTSANTTERIYDWYTHSDNDPALSTIGSSGYLYTFSGPLNPLGFDPFAREGAATRCGFRGEDLRGPRSRTQKTGIRDACMSTQLPFDLKAGGIQCHPAVGSSDAHPPQASLPLDPPIHWRRISSLVLDEASSPVPASSVSDSQHLLDAEAQADELILARTQYSELTPHPLCIPSLRDAQGDSLTQNDLFSDTASSNRSVSEKGSNGIRDEDDFEAFLRPTMERDISQALKRISQIQSPSQGTYVASNGSPYAGAVDRSLMSNLDSEMDSSPTHHRHQTDHFFELHTPKGATRGHQQTRNIKVVISRDTDGEGTALGKPLGFREQRNTCFETASRRKIPRETTNDADWVTESTSEMGFAFGNTTPPSQSFNGIKATGSSIADFSDEDDDNHHQLGRFGSREPILKHPTNNPHLEVYDIRRLKGTKQHVFLPRKTRRYPENSIRLYSSSAKDEPTTAHSTSSHKLSNPFGRGSFLRPEAHKDFAARLKKSGPSKYDFRDSTSEYTPAVSNEATFGTQQTVTRASLPETAEPDTVYDNHPLFTDAQFDESADLEVERNPSERMSAIRQGPPQAPVERSLQRKRQDLGEKQFAAATACELEDEPLSAKSKFKFELLPLEEARMKNKEQRDSGETDETQSAKVRLKRRRSTVTSERSLMEVSPIQAPRIARMRHARVGANLSSCFTPPSITSLQDGWKDTTSLRGFHAREKLSPISSSNRSMLPAHVTSGSPNISGTYEDKRIKRKQTWLERDQMYLVKAKGRYQQQHVDKAIREHMQSNPTPAFGQPGEYISAEDRSRRRLWFYVMAALSILPFVAVLALTGVLDSGLSWLTQGRVSCLSRKQRKYIKYMFLAECIVYTALVVAIVVFTVFKNRNSY
ncbi:hypothetical protein F5Y15DRAFT_429515 [Xylariaceae sp. FL0016]|nr:hypothetical protein F5Y15DRAFT_429515 [Xylariaceae sp. FL0016]